MGDLVSPQQTASALGRELAGAAGAFAGALRVAKDVVSSVEGSMELGNIGRPSLSGPGCR